MRSHSVTCYTTQMNEPHLNFSHAVGTQFVYPKGMEGWVDFGVIIYSDGLSVGSSNHLIATWPRVEPTTSRS